MALLLIAAPWLFGFNDVSDAKTLSIVAGAVMLVGALTTKWRYAVLRIIPLPAHFATDLPLGSLLALSPFVFGFNDHGGAVRFAVIVGILELAIAVSTRWDPVEANPTRHRNRHGHTLLGPSAHTLPFATRR